jgi:hypothetical protein
MKKILSLMIVVLLMSFLLTSTAIASEGSPVGSCPSGFEQHEFMEHADPHMHHHIGITQDLNGDGFICMKMISEDLHLHVDNSLPLP